MSSAFRKPYIRDFYPAKQECRQYVYPREMLMEQDVFPFLVLDGGAFFFMTDRFGDATSQTLLAKTMSGEVFDCLRRADGTIDWGMSYHTTDGTRQAKQHELQSWPQRLYVLLPLAQAYMRTRDKVYADRWIEILRQWVQDSPYEGFHPEISHIKTSMKWRDMQVSWRTMTLLHSIYMLGTDDNGLSREDWQFVYDFLDLNLAHLVLETEEALKVNRYGNHVLQMGSALVSAGILFCELPRAKEYVEAGYRIIRFCIERAIFDDGGSNESSPSYSHFIARLYLEAAAHIERNGYPAIEGLRTSVERQYQWLASCATITGKTLRLSDSYTMDAHKDIQNMAAVFGMEIDYSKKSVCFPDSGFVLLRDGKTEVAIDAMGWYGGHQHNARLQLLVFHDGDEILCDSGCVSYDYWDLYRSLYVSAAHNVLYSPEIPEDAAMRDVQILDFSPADNTAIVATTVSHGDKSYTWRRTVALSEGKVTILDEAEASGELDFEGSYHLPGHQIWVGGMDAQQLTKRYKVDLHVSEPLTLAYKPALDADNRFGFLDRLSYTLRGKTCSVQTELTITPYK